MSNTDIVPRTDTISSSLIDQIRGYEHPELIERLKRKLDLNTEEAENLFDDTKKYLYLCATAKEHLSPTPPIDACWHEFLMYTRDYHAFCMKFFGTFVHHTPTPKLVPHVAPNPHQTRVLAQKTFGKLSRNWHINQQSGHNCTPDFDCHGDGTCGGDV